jgi:hypothetical protein
MEYVPGASLKDIVEYAGNPGESIIQKISHQLLIALDEYNHLTGESYNNFSNSEILFDKYGNLKVRITFIFSWYLIYLKA